MIVDYAIVFFFNIVLVPVTYTHVNRLTSEESMLFACAQKE